MIYPERSSTRGQEKERKKRFPFFFFVDLVRFYTISAIWQSGVVSDRFGNIWSWFGELDWNCLFFCEFELFGSIWADSNGFDWICVDLGWLERLTMDLEDRFKLIFWRILKISLDSCKSCNIFGWVLEDLADFERLWLEFGGFGWIWAQIRVDFQIWFCWL